MSEEFPSNGARNEESAAAQPTTEAPDSVAPSPSETVGAQPESEAQAMLRGAIAKVMKEIEHHEAEAQRHSHLAAALRKDLRDSIAFLRKQGEQKETPAVPGHAAGVGEPAAEQMPKGKATHGGLSGKRRRARAAGKQAPRTARDG
jgi:hypothetical protein